MLITVEQEQKRISQLIRLDDKSSKQSDQYYDEALAYISDHLTEFFAHYAVANNLTLTQVNQRVSKWDLAQWQTCIDELEMDDWLPEAKKKAKAVGIIAGISVRSMMTAIVGMAVINMINKRITLINKRADADRKAEMGRMSKLVGGKDIDAKKADKAIIKAASKEKPKPAEKMSKEPKEADRPTVSDRLWIDGDQMMNDLENMLLDTLKGNMSLEDLRDSLREHVNPDQFDPNKSMADRLRQQNYIIDRLIRTESARMKDRTNDYYFKQNGIKYVNFVCEPGACNKCLAIAAGGPYLLDEAPRIPDETHPNCRCGKVPALNLDDKINQASQNEDAGERSGEKQVSGSKVKGFKGPIKMNLQFWGRDDETGFKDNIKAGKFTKKVADRAVKAYNEIFKNKMVKTQLGNIRVDDKAMYHVFNGHDEMLKPENIQLMKDTLERPNQILETQDFHKHRAQTFVGEKDGRELFVVTRGRIVSAYYPDPEYIKKQRRNGRVIYDKNNRKHDSK